MVALATALATALACTGSNSGVGPTLDKPVYAVLLTPSAASVSVRATRTFSAVAHGVGGALVPNVAFVWSSSNPAVATIDQSGQLTAVDTGHVQITASAEGITAVASVVVTPPPVDSVIVTPPSDTVWLGSQVQLTDTVKDQYGDTLHTPVTWMSSSATVATVTSSGLVVTQGPGVATIIASAGGKSGTSTIVVADSTPASITLQVNPDSVVVIPNPLDALVQLTATVKNRDGRLLPNYPVVFTTSNAVVTGSLGTGPDTVPGGSILILPNGNGTAVITAVAGRFNAQAALTVCYAASSPICNPLAALQVTPAVDTIAAGDSVTMTAIGIDSAGNTYPGMVVGWNAGSVVSSDSSVVIAVAPWGTVYGLNVGTQFVEAGVQGFAAQAEITVVPAPPPTSIASTSVGPASRPTVLAAMRLAGSRQRAARAVEAQTMQQVVQQRLHLTRSPRLQAYYARLVERLAAAQGLVAKGVMAR